jgi:hypothetical protein
VEARLSEEPGAVVPHAGILRQAQYRSVGGLLGNWQSCRDRLTGLTKIGSFTMFILALLEQIDITVGLTSCTMAGVLTSIIYSNFHNLYQRIRPNTSQCIFSNLLRRNYVNISCQVCSNILLWHLNLAFCEFVQQSRR